MFAFFLLCRLCEQFGNWWRSCKTVRRLSPTSFSFPLSCFLEELASFWLFPADVFSALKSLGWTSTKGSVFFFSTVFRVVLGGLGVPIGLLSRVVFGVLGVLVFLGLLSFFSFDLSFFSTFPFFTRCRHFFKNRIWYVVRKGTRISRRNGICANRGSVILSLDLFLWGCFSTIDRVLTAFRSRHPTLFSIRWGILNRIDASLDYSFVFLSFPWIGIWLSDDQIYAASCQHPIGGFGFSVGYPFFSPW